MPRSEKQKLKLVRLIEIFMSRTDAEHGITTAEIISALAEYGIAAERKSIYDDFLALEELGFSVEKMSARPVRYTLVGRLFELAELKLLVDAVGSSKFITAEQSRRLINKLKSLASQNEAGELSRQVYVEGRVKTMNCASIYTIDGIHKALGEGRQISFKYFSYDEKKNKRLRRGGADYRVSPLWLVWSEENYYLVGYDEDRGEVRNFRVDKMQGLDISAEPRSDEALRQASVTRDYSKKIFGMYGGEEVAVTLECDRELANVVIDRFGTEQVFIPTEFGFRVTLPLFVSPTFFGWVMSFGKRMRIISPESVKEKFVLELRETLGGYEEA